MIRRLRALYRDSIIAPIITISIIMFTGLYVFLPMVHESESSLLSTYVMLFVAANLFVLIVHTVLLSNRRSRELKEANEKLEALVAERSSELGNRNQLLSQYKKAVDDGAIVSKTDPSGRITYANKAFERISGYRMQELIGKNHNLVRHSDTPAETFKELWETIKNKQVWHGEIKNRAKDGSAYYVNATICPIVDEHGEIVEYLAIRYDTTPLHTMLIEAQQAERAKGQFLANMSHELRTPLNSIIGFSQILQHRSSIPESEMRFVNNIMVSGQNLLTLVNTILDFTKIDEGKMEFFPSPFFIDSLFRELGILMEIQAQQKELQLRIGPVNAKVQMVADMQLLKQSLVNLLSNAVKFSASHSKVSLGYESSDSEHIFSVADSGPGISKQEQERLFKPFVQGEEAIAQAMKGTGLGLSLTKRIVEDIHGGRIWLESEMGQGSCFYIAIPKSLEQSIRQISKSKGDFEGLDR